MEEKLISPELLMLVASSGILITVVMLQLMHFLSTGIAVSVMSNRDEHEFPSEMKGLGGRLKRCIRNHVEGIAMAAPIILTASLSGISNEMTVLGAQTFAVGRLAHATLYIFGVPYIRSGAFLIGIIGIALVLYGLFLI